MALQSRTEQNTQEQVALLRKAGIAEQMKLGPSQGSCDMKHGVGYWGDIPSGFNGILESLSTVRAAGQNQKF